MGHLQLARGRHVFALAALGALLSFSQIAAAQTDVSETAAAEEPSNEDLATARLHFKNGVDLLQSTPPNYQDAYRQFELAREKSGSWKVLGNLGLCALKLERDGEALSFYGEYLEKGGDEIDPAERKEIERELLLLKGNLTTVRVESSEPDARISVKRQSSHAPTQLYSLDAGKAELGLRSGSLVIIARSGDKALEWKPVLSAGEEATHVFNFDEPPTAEKAATPAPAPAPSTADVAVDPSSDGPNGMRIAGFVTAGVGVVALGTGAVFGIVSQNQAQKAEDQCIDGFCQEATEGDFDRAQSSATLANILLIGGGVLAATGVTLIVLGGNSSSESAPSTASLQLTPAPTLGGAGVFASGHF